VLTPLYTVFVLLGVHNTNTCYRVTLSKRKTACCVLMGTSRSLNHKSCLPDYPACKSQSLFQGVLKSNEVSVSGCIDFRASCLCAEHLQNNKFDHCWSHIVHYGSLSARLKHMVNLGRAITAVTTMYSVEHKCLYKQPRSDSQTASVNFFAAGQSFETTSRNPHI